MFYSPRSSAVCCFGAIFTWFQLRKTKQNKNFSTDVRTWDFWHDHISWIQRENAAAKWCYWVAEAIFTFPNFRAKKFYIIKWLFCVISTQAVREISLWEQWAESRPPTPAHERAKRRRLGHGYEHVSQATVLRTRPDGYMQIFLESNFPRAQPRAGPANTASHLPVRSAVASHRRNMSMMDALGRRGFFFSLSAAFSRVASSTSPLSSDLSSSYLPSTAPSLATASFSSTSIY